MSNRAFPTAVITSFAIIGSFFCLTRIVEQRIGLTMSMKTLRVLWVFIVLAAFAACQRQRTEEQKNTEMTPASSASPSASPENPYGLKSQAQRFQPRRVVPMTSPITETPTPTPTPSER